MLTLKYTSVMKLENAIRGARNPMNSWGRMDSHTEPDGSFVFGPNDLDLAMRLAKAGSDHRKYLRMVFVSVDVTAPLYWWKEYDTYKVGTVANSTSTMHKITSKPFEMSDLSCDKLDEESFKVLENFMAYMESLRVRYNETKDRQLWYDIIQLLPSSSNQMRTCTFNYENLIAMYYARKNHNLDEWHVFCDWVKTLPYAEDMILVKEEENV